MRLFERAPRIGRELVNVAVPCPPGFLPDAQTIRAFDATGAGLEITTWPLEPWRIDGRSGTIRSVLIQWMVDGSRPVETRIRVRFDLAGRAGSDRRARPVAETLDAKSPRVLVTLPAEWLCESWIAGPQVPASRSGSYAEYDRFVDRSFPESTKYLDSDVYHHWLFDRTTCWYKQYVRTGEPRFLEAAYRAAHFVRAHTALSGPDAGYFTLKGVDLKYVYPRAMTGRCTIPTKRSSKAPRRPG